MAKTIQQLQEFHEAMGLPSPPTFELPPQTEVARGATLVMADVMSRQADMLKTIGALQGDDAILLRVRLIVEELGEVIEAITEGKPEDILWELTDLRYVVEGTVVALGLGHVADEAFNRIHEANMSKLDDAGNPVREAGGKVIKGPNYRKADLSGLVS